MKKLCIIGAPDVAFELLGEYAGLYGDNGGDPDGNAWLPSNQDDIPEEVAQTVIRQGYGKMVEVRMANDEAMITFLDLYPPTEGEIDEEYAERMIDRANERQLAWAHFGAYGAMDSHWVFTSEE